MHTSTIEHERLRLLLLPCDQWRFPREQALTNAQKSADHRHGICLLLLRVAEVRLERRRPHVDDVLFDLLRAANEAH